MYVQYFYFTSKLQIIAYIKITLICKVMLYFNCWFLGHEYNDDDIISNTKHSIEKNSSFCQLDERKHTINGMFY